MKCWSCEKFLTCPQTTHTESDACENFVYEPGSDEQERHYETE